MCREKLPARSFPLLFVFCAMASLEVFIALVVLASAAFEVTAHSDALLSVVLLVSNGKSNIADIGYIVKIYLSVVGKILAMSNCLNNNSRL